MTTGLDDLILEEWDRFIVKLPELIKKHRDKWVVFKDGSDHGSYDSEDAAFDAAVARWGPDGGFVVAKASEQKPSLVLFGRA